MGTTMPAHAGRIALAGALVMAAGGCEWAQFRSDAAHTGNVYETTLDTGNVAELAPAWSVEVERSLGGVVTAAGAVAFVADGEVRAYEQTTGALRWHVPLPQHPIGSRTWTPLSGRDGNVYVGFTDPLTSGGVHGGFLVVDALTGEAHESFSQGAPQSTATFAGDDVWYAYVEVAPMAQGAFAGVEGRLADGRTMRSFEVPSASANAGAPAVGGGLVYARRSNGGFLDAFDAAAQENCSNAGNFRLCSPLWSAPVVGFPSPVVSGGTVYARNGDAVAAYASDVRGPDQQPLWQAPVAAPSLLAVDPAADATRLFVGSSDGSLKAFDAAGCGAASCDPLWQAEVGAQVGVPLVANGVVFAGSADGRVHAFDAGGCGAATCEPLWTATVPGTPSTTIVANGRLIVLTTTHELVVFALPRS
jgi:outer membrane protein assembly factor BamB